MRGRVPEQVDQDAHPLGGGHAVDRAVIDRQRQMHHLTDLSGRPMA